MNTRRGQGGALVGTMREEAKVAGVPDPFHDVPGSIRRGMAWESLEAGDSDLGDRQIADLAIDALGRTRDREEPLFLAVLEGAGTGAVEF